MLYYYAKTRKTKQTYNEKGKIRTIAFHRNIILFNIISRLYKNMLFGFKIEWNKVLLISFIIL